MIILCWEGTRGGARSGDNVVAVDRDGGVGPGGQWRLQQDLAGAGVERVQVTLERGGEDDVVCDRGGAVRRGWERGVPFDRAGVLVDRDHLAGRLLDGRQVGS